MLRCCDELECNMLVVQECEFVRLCWDDDEGDEEGDKEGDHGRGGDDFVCLAAKCEVESVCEGMLA